MIRVVTATALIVGSGWDVGTSVWKISFDSLADGVAVSVAVCASDLDCDLCGLDVGRADLVCE
jgi:hypothetical protein